MSMMARKADAVGSVWYTAGRPCANHAGRCGVGAGDGRWRCPRKGSPREHWRRGASGPQKPGSHVQKARREAAARANETTWPVDPSAHPPANLYCNTGRWVGHPLRAGALVSQTNLGDIKNRQEGPALGASGRTETRP
eukprot:scaffold2753_cov115-Isochrysis_galbana.AAC.8